MFATGWRPLSHRDGLHDDPNPRPEHAEAVVQWQSRAHGLMWEAAFGLALWHSGDSRGCRIHHQAVRHSVDNSLSDDQKARFNSMGRQLFAQNGGRQSSNEQREAR
jgi:hypothetical protein